MGNIKLTWDEWYILAKKYYYHYHNLKINAKFKTYNGIDYHEDGYQLGRWIRTQRQRYAGIRNDLSPLTEEQLKKLNDIEMIFNAHEYNWNKMYYEAYRYYIFFGNLHVSKDYITDTGKPLGEWIRTQRKAYEIIFNDNLSYISKYTPLSCRQILMLESIDMIWDISKNNEDCMFFARTHKLNYSLIKEHTINNLYARCEFLIENGYNIEDNKEIFYMNNEEIAKKYAIDGIKIFNRHADRKKVLSRKK